MGDGDSDNCVGTGEDGDRRGEREKKRTEADEDKITEENTSGGDNTTALTPGRCIDTMEGKTNRTNLYQSVVILNLTYLVCGTTFAWSSPMLGKLGLTASEGSTVASMLSLGSVAGPFVSGAALDWLGRKSTVGLSMGLMTTSYLLLTFAKDLACLSLGRFIAGVTVGIVFSAVPSYIAEISEDSVRGLLNTLSQISGCSGSLLVYAVGPTLRYATLHYILLALCGVFFLCFPLLPSSPYTQVMKNNHNAARETLAWLRGNKSPSSIEKELQVIQNTIRQNKEEKGSVKDLFQVRGNFKALLLCSGLLAFQQVSGISIILFYAEQIFHMTGSTISNTTCSVIIGVIMTASSFICPVAVKYLGYKRPLMVSAFGMALGMGGLGVFFVLKLNNFDVEEINWLPLLSVVTYIVFFNVGFANIPWALSGELFPSNIKPLATTFISSTCGLLAFFTTKLFPTMVELIGLDFLFMACSFFCCLAIVFITLVMQETSGLSFAEIQEILNGRKRKNLNQPL